MKYPGMLTFIPQPVPEMPYPYRDQDTFMDRWNYQKAHPGGDLNEEQLILNHQAVEAGNRAASALVGAYNSQIIRYYDNGGAKNKYGLVLPTTLPVLEACFPPAPDATVHYDPIAKKWVPSTIHLEAAPWVLPADAVLFIQS